jgi:hypothetical protein
MGQQREQREESMPLLYSPAISTEGRIDATVILDMFKVILIKKKL